MGLSSPRSSNGFRFHFSGGALHSLNDVLIAGAAAQIALKGMTYLFFCGIRIALQNLGRSHNHAWCAESALQSVVLPERLLHRMKIALLCQAFNGRYASAVSLRGQNRAGLHGLSIEHDGACAAERGLATDVSSRKAEHIAQVVDQQHARLNFALVRGSIHSEVDFCHWTTS
jgi:hypothetical protein